MVSYVNVCWREFYDGVLTFKVIDVMYFCCKLQHCVYACSMFYALLSL